MRVWMGRSLLVAIMLVFLAGCSTVGVPDISESNGEDVSSSIAVNNSANMEEISNVVLDEFGSASVARGVVSGDSDNSEITTSGIPLSSSVTLSDIKFVKSTGSTAGFSGGLEIFLTGEATYLFERTAPSEYVLRIPGVLVSDSVRVARMAPSDLHGSASRGIRAVRVGEGATDAEVRVFVDAGTELSTSTIGNTVRIFRTGDIVDASAASPTSGVRAQLSKSESTVHSEVVKGSGKSGSSDSTNTTTNSATTKSSDGSKVYEGRLISIDLQDTDIENALRIIAEVSGLNIITSQDVKGKVNLRLIDVPWDQVLDVILKTNGLDQVREGVVLRIAPVEKLRAEREALLQSKQAAEALEDLQVSYTRISYSRAADMKEQVQTVLSERGSVSTDERTNQLVIRDVAKAQVAAAELLRKLDLRTPQVLLETEIVESTKNLVRSLGFQWNYNFAMSSRYGNATGLNFPSSFNVAGSAVKNEETWLSSFPAVEGSGAVTALMDSADGARSLAARLSAYESEGLVKVISRPQVVTVNNKEAKIEATEVMRVRLQDQGTNIATGQGASAKSGSGTATEAIKVGIELYVTPQASPDNYVLLDVRAKSSTFGSDKVDGIPNTIEREGNSTVLVKSGQTFALGGVYRLNDSDVLSGLPFLKDIPFLGHFFRSTDVIKKDEELIFFITPRVIEGSFENAKEGM